MAIRLAQLGPSLTQMPNTGPHLQGITDSFINIDAQTIPMGTPVFLAANGFEDGLAVVLPSSMAAVNSGNCEIFVGITINSVAPFAPIDCVVRNLHNAAKITLQTRSASTAGWASWPAINIGDLLSIETVNNGFSRSTSGGQNYAGPLFQAAFVAASGTTQASSFATGSQTLTYVAFTTSGPAGSVSDTTTTLTATYTLSTNASALYMSGKVFVRSM